MAEYQGVVVNAKGDPKKLLRVQVRIPGLMDGVPDSKLPWATYKLPIGAGAGRGDFTPVQNVDRISRKPHLGDLTRHLVRYEHYQQCAVCEYPVCRA